MSVLSNLFGKSKNQKISELEQKVELLENVLHEVSLNMKKLAYLSLRTGEELEALSQYVKANAEFVAAKDQSKKPDDFYN